MKNVLEKLKSYDIGFDDSIPFCSREVTGLTGLLALARLVDKGEAEQKLKDEIEHFINLQIKSDLNNTCYKKFFDNIVAELIEEKTDLYSEIEEKLSGKSYRARLSYDKELKQIYASLFPVEEMKLKRLLAQNKLEYTSSSYSGKMKIIFYKSVCNDNIEQIFENFKKIIRQ